MIELETVVDGLVFPEGPRWRSDTLWFSDVLGGRVLRLDGGGEVHTVATVEGRPSGLGFALDGSLLVVSMLERQVLRVTGDRTEVMADLSSLTPYPCNDMVVDALGRAYVGCMGGPMTEPNQGAGSLVLVEPDGRARVVATGLSGPNGCVIGLDGRTLVVAESSGMRLSAFDIEPDGSLTGQRLLCDIGSHVDGICLDANGSIWVASPRTNSLFFVAADGRLVERLETPSVVIACALGGADGRTLYLGTVESMPASLSPSPATGRIEAMRVDVPGVEMP